jgi:hypothetical protein
MAVSGYDLATGMELFGEEMEGNKALYLIPFAAIMAGGFALFSTSAWLFRLGQILSATIGFAAFGITLLTSGPGPGGTGGPGGGQSFMFDISTEVGLWGTIGGLLLMIVAAVMPSHRLDPPVEE